MSVPLSRLDDIEHRISRIEEASAATAVAATAPIQWGVASGISSIASALAEPIYKIGTSLRRPFLSPPEPFYMPKLLDVEMEMYKLLNQEATSLDESGQEKLKRVTAYGLKCIELLKNNSEALKSQEKWGAWQNVAEYVGYASAIILGVACWEVSVPTALFFMAAGVVGLVNRVGTDTSGWNHLAAYFKAEQKEQLLLAQKIESTLSTAAIALSVAAIASGMYFKTYEALATSSKDLIISKVSSFLNLAAGAVGAVSKTGESFYNKRALEIQADLEKLHAERSILSNDIQKDTGVIKRMFELSEEIDNVIKMAINSSTVTE